MPAITQLPATGAISIGDIRNKHGIKTTPGQGYTAAGPVTSSSMEYNYVPATVALPINNYYGADPEKGTTPSSGTISLGSFWSTRPSAKFYCGYENSSVNTNAKRYGYGDAFTQQYNTVKGRIYSEGSRFIQPERGCTTLQLGSISHRSLISAVTNNVWVTGIQVQRMQGDTGVTYLVLFLETSLGNGYDLLGINASFSNMVLRFGTNSYSIPFSARINPSDNYPRDGIYQYQNEFGSDYFIPPFFYWSGYSSGTSTQLIIHTTIWNAFVNAYNTGTPGYVYFT